MIYRFDLSLAPWLNRELLSATLAKLKSSYTIAKAFLMASQGIEATRRQLSLFTDSRTVTQIEHQF